jgi:BON domain
MRAEKFTLVLWLLLLSGVTESCSRKSTDRRIAKDIQQQVAADPETKHSPVQVTVQSGRVRLVGEVDTPLAQQEVEDIAQKEPGVKAVDDETIVEPVSAPSAPLAAQPPPPQPAPLQPALPAAQPQPPASQPPATLAADTAEPLPRPPKALAIVAPAGTTLLIRTGTSLSSGTSQTGQVFVGSLARPVRIRGTTVFPSGSRVTGTVVDAQKRGKIKGEAVLNLTLTSITAHGRTYSIRTGVLENTAKGKGKRTAATTGGGAAGGGLIGGIAGGGKGVGIGALLGAGAGLVGGAVSGNQQIELPSESALSFRLASPVTITPRQ